MGHGRLELPGEVAAADGAQGAGQEPFEDDLVARAGFEAACEFEAEDIGLLVELRLFKNLGLAFAGDLDGCWIGE